MIAESHLRCWLLRRGWELLGRLPRKLTRKLVDGGRLWIGREQWRRVGSKGRRRKEEGPSKHELRERAMELELPPS